MADAAILATLKVLGDVQATELVKLAVSRTSKIGSTFIKLKGSINTISRELRVMRGYLDEMNIDDEDNKSQAAWIKEVQNLANHIEDIAVEFAYLVGNKKFGAISFYVKTMLKEPKLFSALKRIASELSDIEKSLKHLAELKERWVTKRKSRIHKNIDYSDEYSHNAAVSAHFIDEDDIVGIEESRLVLKSWIISKKPQLSVISVWGMGGVGKTTLVTNVYKRERKNFDCRAWVSISQSYTIENILWNIITEICKDDQSVLINRTNMSLRGLKETLRGLLKEMKYLIVLDDMWDPKVFLDISDTFIDNHRGSRIVITSRMAEVANLAPENNRLELKPLSKEESWDLFCRKAFPLETNHECPLPVNEWAREIVSKCDGLPLALVSLGGVLSLVEKTKSEWKRVCDQLSWELDNNPGLGHLKNILNLSFSYLPRYLKNCIFYCGLFPEDSLLARKKLIRFWVAEGFIEQKGRSTLEEVAEGYLNELIRRSMLQVVQKNSSGRVKRCRMHDTLRELAISLCRKENFGSLHEDNKTVNYNPSIRRLSIVKRREEICHDVYLPQLRTFISVDPTIPSTPLISSILSKSRYLTVLSLEGLPIKIIPDSIGDLFNLHYLGLRGTRVKFLPKSIVKLKNLQTLDLMDSSIQKLPDGIAELKKLRHLFAQVRVDPTYRIFRSVAGVSLPKAMFYLKELQTIEALESNANVVRVLGNLTQLRSFRILNVKENHSAELCRSLSKMTCLSYLSIFASNENCLLQLEDLILLPQLKKLTLFGRLKEQMLKSPSFRISGGGIQNLRLGWSQLKNDPLPSISHLKNLTWLTLQKAYEGRELKFKAEWFPKLKYLALRQMPNLVQVEMEQETMVNLATIQLWELEQLFEIPEGIEHLTNLKLVVCKFMRTGFGGLASGIHQLFHFRCHVF
ncbi:Disease resistance protein RPM1 [Rhynchospora pubera]|uniref:Disease resistance protein RPM1 n=1 Tax=Rhynchospora pubera TaxID=906938 RepID=A0AAV8GEA6_9POAL|nr:Disease resistance protein RPM1 [Rhynchospora pubera]